MGQTILLVEDHQDTANAFMRMLRRDGYDVTIASTAARALELCGTQAFDLLICDINLPDGNGAEILKVARQYHVQTRGIIVSGHDEPEYLKAARDAGFSKIFLKPIDYISLRQALRELLLGA
ncbi:MAG TPA: response regulator [Tepidisphaeraceae bacterium]|jgi:DNA-binding response OmpR family regulator